MHQWDLTPKEAITLQKSLRDQVRQAPLIKPVRFIAGCDVSMNRFAKEGFAGFVVMTYPELTVVETSVVKGPLPFPYIPGLLSFREIPLLLEAWEKLVQKPDVVFVDGVGFAHPRRLGIATHLGLELGVPTIGCGKSVLTGIYKEPGPHAGSASPLTDTKTGEIIGMAVRTKDKVKPMFISFGNNITLKECVELVQSAVRKHRLPEPTRLAHEAVNAVRTKDMLG